MSSMPKKIKCHTATGKKSGDELKTAQLKFSQQFRKLYFGLFLIFKQKE